MMGKNSSKVKLKKMVAKPKKRDCDFSNLTEDGVFYGFSLPEPGTPPAVSACDQVPYSQCIINLDESASASETVGLNRSATPFPFGQHIASAAFVGQIKLPKIDEMSGFSTPFSPRVDYEASKTQLSFEDELGMQEIHDKLPWLSDIEDFESGLSKDKKIEPLSCKSKCRDTGVIGGLMDGKQDETDSSLNESVSLNFEKSSSSNSVVTVEENDVNAQTSSLVLEFAKGIVNDCVENAMFISEMEKVELGEILPNSSSKFKKSERQDNLCYMLRSFCMEHQETKPGTSRDTTQVVNRLPRVEESLIQIISESHNVRMQNSPLDKSLTYTRCFQLPQYYPTANFYFSESSFVDSGSGELRTPRIKFQELEALPEIAVRAHPKNDTKCEGDFRAPGYSTVSKEGRGIVENTDADRLFKQTKYFKDVSQYKPELCENLPPRNSMLRESMTPMNDSPTMSASSTHRGKRLKITKKTNTVQGFYAKIKKKKPEPSNKSRSLDRIDVATNTIEDSLEDGREDDRLEAIRKAQLKKYIKKSKRRWNIIYRAFALFSLIIVASGFYGMYDFFGREKPDLVPVTEAASEDYEMELYSDKSVFRQRFWYVPYSWFA